MDIENLKILGISLGIIAFFWKVRDSIISYLVINVSAEFDFSNNLIVETSITNTGPARKRIDNALLLIAPISKDPIKAFNQLFENNPDIYSELGSNRKFNSIYSTRGIAVNKFKQTIDDGDVTLVPLPFYYDEIGSIGDEKVCYKLYIDLDNIKNDKPYSVRFYVWGRWWLHRTTQDAFKKLT